MHNEKSNNAENVKDDNDKERSHINNPNDEVSLHPSSQDSLLNEILYVRDETNGSISDAEVPHSSEKFADMNSTSPSKLSDHNSLFLYLKTKEVTSVSVLSEDNSTPIGVGEGATEDDDDDVIIVNDSPRKEEPGPPAVQKIEEAITNLKNAFLEGKEESNKSSQEINRLKKEQERAKESLRVKKISLDTMKRCQKAGLFGNEERSEAKRAKVEMVTLEEDINSLESKIREGKKEEKINKRKIDSLEKAFQNIQTLIRN